MTPAPPPHEQEESTETTAARMALLFVEAEPDSDVVRAQLRDVRTVRFGERNFQVGRLSDRDDWDVAVVVTGTGEREARAACEDAIESLDPTILLFVSTGLPGDGSPGDVIAAAQISRVSPRPITRTGSDDLLRHVSRVCAEGSWVDRVRLKSDEVGAASLRPVVTGPMPNGPELPAHHVVGNPFGTVAAVVPDRWGHVQALYADDNLPALAFCALLGGTDPEDEARRVATDHATALALAMLASNPLSEPGSFESVLHDGLEDHDPADAESLPLERAEGFLQRRFVSTGLHSMVRRAPPNGESDKKLLGREQVKAYMQTVGSDRRAVLPPDVEIVIELRGNELQFFLTVNRYADGLTRYRRKPVGSARLGEVGGIGIEEYSRTLMQRLYAMAKDPPETDKPLNDIGTRLFAQFFPDDLKREYGDFRDKIETLSISSDDPWIPWELARPYSSTAPNDYQDDFLAAQFHLTRWHGDEQPWPRFEITHIAWVEAGAVEGQKVLASAAAECGRLARLARKRALGILSPKNADWEAIQTLFGRQEDIQLWHVAAHGQLNPEEPERNAVVLRGGCWEASELAGREVEMAIAKAHPLVFFNACLVARQDISVNKLAGWPAAWLNCRCGAFLGPQWSLDSELAATFSKTFYDALDNREKLGVAATMAREAVRKSAPNDPAWLSYAVYGHPNAEIEFVGSQSQEQE